MFGDYCLFPFCCRLKQYIYKDMEQQQTDEATALEEH